MPLPISTHHRPTVGLRYREQIEYLPMALSGLGIAVSWERSSISLIPGYLIQVEETSLPREAVSELGFSSPAMQEAQRH